MWNCPPKADPEVHELTDDDSDIDSDASENELYTTNTMQLNCTTSRVLCSDHHPDVKNNPITILDPLIEDASMVHDFNVPSTINEFGSFHERHSQVQLYLCFYRYRYAVFQQHTFRD